MGKLWNWFRDSQQPLRKSPARAPKRSSLLLDNGEPTHIGDIALSYDHQAVTYKQGNLEAAYSQLERLLGPPNAPVDNYKTTAQWDLKYEGSPITIYDYKASSAYGSGRPSPDKLRALSEHRWHIGSDGSETAARGIQRIKDGLARRRR